ncbi:MAG: ubiquinol-cytochrome c reductase iron-sulfur subunit [Ignavibacteriae bacterium]|nr:ubiquinol-cytochrome c reductase iron-sulfur subunit [Ignavibacteriota bacterium]
MANTEELQHTTPLRKEIAVDKTRGLWITRRDLLSLSGWIAFFVFLGISILSTIRFFFPRVLFESAPVFKAGFPDEYALGEVSSKYLKSKQVWVVHEEEGFYALSAVCTHLGCTPRWLETENKFKCPCHGSGFHLSGINFEGPAPRPLERVKITLNENGELVVDKSVKFLYERGEWGKPGSFLKKI